MKDNPFRYFSIASLKELLNIFMDSPRQNNRYERLFELLGQELEKQLEAREKSKDEEPC